MRRFSQSNMLSCVLIALICCTVVFGVTRRARADAQQDAYNALQAVASDIYDCEMAQQTLSGQKTTEWNRWCADITAYNASHSWCETCGTILNDEIGTHFSNFDTYHSSADTNIGNAEYYKSIAQDYYNYGNYPWCITYCGYADDYGIYPCEYDQMMQTYYLGEVDDGLDIVEFHMAR